MIKKLTVIFKDTEAEEVLNLSSLNNGDKIVVIDVKAGSKTAVSSEELEAALKELKEFNKNEQKQPIFVIPKGTDLIVQGLGES